MTPSSPTEPSPAPAVALPASAPHDRQPSSALAGAIPAAVSAAASDASGPSPSAWRAAAKSADARPAPSDAALPAPRPIHPLPLITRDPLPAPNGLPRTLARPPDLLLVHGAGHGAWCWEKLQARCALLGIRTHAIDLRGHGGNPGSGDPTYLRLDGYVADVAQAVAQIPAPFVLVGHSLGGIVIQRYLSWLADGRPLPRPAGAILMATATPADLLRGWKPLLLFRLYGFWGLVTMLARTLAGTRPIDMCPTPGHTRRLFFTATTPEADVLACYLRLCGEAPALWRDVRRFAQRWRAPGAAGVPTLVLGGALDACVAPAHIKRLAQRHGATVHLFAEMGHDLMLDVGWEAVADAVADWLRDLSITPPDAPMPPDRQGGEGSSTAASAPALVAAAVPTRQMVPLRPLWAEPPDPVPAPAPDTDTPAAASSIASSISAGSWNTTRPQPPTRPPHRDPAALRHHRHTG